MKKFKEFIAEEIKYKEEIDGDEKDRSFMVIHHASIGPHSLNVMHTITKGRGQTHIETDFEVNGEMSSYHTGQVSDEHKYQILRTVDKSVRDTITKYKPNMVSFYGNSDQKHNMYGEYSRKIAKMMGGKHSERNDVHNIRFKR